MHEDNGKDDNVLDFEMAFQDSADKPTLLLIHGFPLNSNMWQAQLEDLADFFRVIAPDLRGHGLSENVPGPYSVQMLADDCADLLGHLNVPTPLVVCGLSMGGYIALEFVRRYPEEVAGLILASTKAKPDTPEGKLGRDAAAANVRAEGVTPLAENMLSKLIAPQVAADDPDLVQFVREIMLDTSVEGAVGALQAMRDRQDSEPLLAELQIPILIIHGGEDQVIPKAEAESMAAMAKDAQLVILPNVGHLPNMEAPHKFNDAVIDFMEKLELG